MQNCPNTSSRSEAKTSGALKLDEKPTEMKKSNAHPTETQKINTPDQNGQRHAGRSL